MSTEKTTTIIAGAVAAGAAYIIIQQQRKINAQQLYIASLDAELEGVRNLLNSAIEHIERTEKKPTAKQVIQQIKKSAKSTPFDVKKTAILKTKNNAKTKQTKPAATKKPVKKRD